MGQPGSIAKSECYEQVGHAETRNNWENEGSFCGQMGRANRYGRVYMF